MEERKQKAYDIFMQGYSCAQAVVGAFDDILPLDKEALLNLAIPFGGGFARTRNICGAVSAFGLVIGLLRGKEQKDAKDKKSVYEEIQNLVNQFKERNISDNCGILLKDAKNITQGYVPQVRDAAYYETRPCVKFVLDAVEILENHLSGEQAV